MTGPWTPDEIRALGVVTDVPTAGSIFGLHTTKSYELARAGEFPVPVLKLGAQSYRVPVAPILRLLGLDNDEGAAPNAAPVASDRTAAQAGEVG